MRKLSAKPSIYADLSPEQCVQLYRKRILLIAIGALGLSFVLWGIVLIALRETPIVLILIYVLLIAVLVLPKALQLVATQLLEIYNTDCDPQKLLDTTSIINNGDNDAQRWLELRATCLLALGRIEEAKGVIARIPYRDTKPAERATKHQVAMSVYTAENNISALKNERGALEGLLRRENLPEFDKHKGQFNIAAANFKIALAEGNLSAAHAELDQMRAFAWCKVCHVTTCFRAAELAEVEGDHTGALQNYTYVAEVGGTLDLSEQARQWLKRTQH